MASGFNSQKKRSTLDMISNLPEEVTAEILKYLPIKEAVGTSKLSRHWRYQWMGLQELKFNDCAAIAQGQATTNLANVVNTALLLHRRPITRFEVYSSSYPSSDVDRWLLVLSRKNLQHLILRFRMPTPTPTPTQYYLPSSLFTYQYLRTLELESCALRLPPQFRFNFLTRLTLRRSYIDNRTLQSLVTNSPLQSLHLAMCYFFSLSICAPNLEHCSIFAAYRSISFVHTPKLKKARLSFNSKDTNSIMADLWQFRSSPFLKEINIHAWSFPPRRVQQEHFWEKKDAVLQHLQTVNFVHFTEKQNELQLIQFFLHKATELQTININWKKPVQKQHILEKLLQFPRTSSAARINII